MILSVSFSTVELVVMADSERSVCLWRHFLKCHNYTVVSEHNVGQQLSSEKCSLIIIKDGNDAISRIVSSQAANEKILKRQLSLHKTRPFRPLPWLHGETDTKSAQSLTDSSLLSSDAWICSNTSTSSYASNCYPHISSIKGNRPPKFLE
jgi:hypothetical protein